MNDPLVSVCIGTYNRAGYLPQTLDGVFAQTFKDYEVIVVDDASADDTVRVIAPYLDRLTFIRREQNSGMCGVTRNDGIRRARGKYVALLDSDDGWYPTKLEAQIAFLESHPDVPWCHSYVHVLDEASKVLGVRHEGMLPPTGRCFQRLLRHCFISTSSVVIRRDVFDQVGLFPDDTVYGAAGEEFFFFLRVARERPLGLVDQVLAKYRRSAAGSMADANGWKFVPEVVPLQELVLKDEGLWKGVVPRSEPLEVLIGGCVENGTYWADRREYGHSMFFARKALKYSPFFGPAWMILARSLARRLVPKR
jgi:glycosyltransferase involved in cell wall biosynthesis